MLNVLWCLLSAARSLLKTQRELALENLALRHQIGVLNRAVHPRNVVARDVEPRSAAKDAQGKEDPLAGEAYAATRAHQSRTPDALLPAVVTPLHGEVTPPAARTDDADRQ